MKQPYQNAMPAKMHEKRFGIWQPKGAEQTCGLYWFIRRNDLRNQQFQPNAGIFDMGDLICLPLIS